MKCKIFYAKDGYLVGKVGHPMILLEDAINDWLINNNAPKHISQSQSGDLVTITIFC